MVGDEVWWVAVWAVFMVKGNVRGWRILEGGVVGN